MRVLAAFAYLLIAVVAGFLAGAFLLFGGSGGVLPAVAALLVAIVFGVLAYRASGPTRL